MSKHERFDVVVVGAGAAGCVVAARLSEDASRTVALLEAGPDLAPDDDLLEAWRLPRPPDWGFTSEPSDGREAAPLRRSRLVGGTSWLTRFALRGQPGDLDAWAELGNPGWRFDDVLPALRRLETDAEYGDRPWHGSDGPLPVTRYLGLPRGAGHEAAIEAALACGFDAVEDHNAPGAVGVGPMPMSSIDGRRVTTSAAYLEPARDRANLAVRAEAEVAAVAFHGTRASGVRLVDGTLVEAERVVLCAGTYGSPAILLRSGIGPAGDLAALGIRVRADLPGVGGNLADHPGIDIELPPPATRLGRPRHHSVATFHTGATPTSEPPDAMLWLSDDEDPPAVEAVLLRPRSRGRVSLRSADPADAPRIRLPVPGADAGDLERLVEAHERARAIAEHPAVRRATGGTPDGLPDDRAAVAAHVAAHAYSVPHVVGTCAMGPTPAAGGVVDARLRVHGLEGLMVADASVIPLPPSGFTHLPTILVAERVAELMAGS